jgi:hypothetical protein
MAAAGGQGFARRVVPPNDHDLLFGSGDVLRGGGGHHSGPGRRRPAHLGSPGRDEAAQRPVGHLGRATTAPATESSFRSAATRLRTRYLSRIAAAGGSGRRSVGNVAVILGGVVAVRGVGDHGRHRTQRLVIGVEDGACLGRGARRWHDRTNPRPAAQPGAGSGAILGVIRRDLGRVRRSRHSDSRVRRSRVRRSHLRDCRVHDSRVRNRRLRDSRARRCLRGLRRSGRLRHRDQ